MNRFEVRIESFRRTQAGDTRFELPQSSQHRSEVIVRSDIGWIERNRLGAFHDRLFRVAATSQHHSEVRVKASEVRIHFDRLLKRLDRLGQSLLVLEGDSQIIECAGIGGVNSKRLAKRGFRFRIPFEFTEHQAETIMKLGDGGIDRDGFTKLHLRLFVSTLLLVCVAEIEFRKGTCGVQFGGSTGVRYGDVDQWIFFGISSQSGPQDEIEMGRRDVRTNGDRGGRVTKCLFRASLVPQRLR